MQRRGDTQSGSVAGIERLGARFSGSGDPVFLDPQSVIRLRRPRANVRDMMILVALAAMATEGVLVGWRVLRYHKRADDHARYLNSTRSLLYDSEALRQWHERMRLKYELAASRPWLLVEPDPPPPG